MKLRVICIIAAAMLLAGCGDTSRISDTSEAAESTVSTTASTAEKTPDTTSQTVSEATGAAESGSAGGVSLDSVMLTDEQKQLKKLVSGAKNFCDFEELGVKLTVSTDIDQRIKALHGITDDVNHGVHIISCDGGCAYCLLSVLEPREEIVIDEYGISHLLSKPVYFSYYFCFDCETDELTQIYSPIEDYEIYMVSGEAMLLRKVIESSDIMGVADQCVYKLVNRESGYAADIDADIYGYDDIVLLGNALYYCSGGSLYSCTVEADRSIVTPLLYQSDSDFSVYRGVHNVIIYDDSAVGRTISGDRYLISDPKKRLKDFVFETYYQGAAMTEGNILGWRTRISITDRYDNETLLGYIQTQDKPYLGSDVTLNATKDGIILLQIPDSKPIVMLGAYNDFSGITAAYMPDEAVQQSRLTGVYCDFDTLYLAYYKDDAAPAMLVTLSLADY